VLGVFEDSVFDQTTLTLTSPGDTLVLLTDGILEAQEEGGRRPGVEGVLAMLDRSRDRSAPALAYYGGLLERDPESAEVRAAHREILLRHARRIELRHYTLLQRAATHHVEEAAWKAWLADHWWVRAGTRYGSYRQDTLPGQPGFTREIWTVLASLGFEPRPGLSLSIGLEEARRRADAFGLGVAAALSSHQRK